MELQSTDMLELDAQYRPIPPFTDWAACKVDTSRWQHYKQRVANLSGSDKEVLNRSLEVVKKAAAIETGAIENLYVLPTGFTITAATQAAFLESAFIQANQKARSYIESQLEAYDTVLDFATQQSPIAEAWIRQLHAQICRSQDTYPVQTPVGEQEHPLPKGCYKTMPNHVLTPEGRIHAYAPVGMVTDEMHKLCGELGNKSFRSAHPILQAAFAHHCLVKIHPFADGNGRVARALGSVFTFRSDSMPLLILVEHRKAYTAALREADEGRYQAFVDFIFERTITALQVLEESIRSAEVPPVDDVLKNLAKLYKTSGGFTHVDVDSAAHRLFELYFQEVRDQLSQNTSGTFFSAEVTQDTEVHTPQNDNSRLPINFGPRRAVIHFKSLPPAVGSVVVSLSVEVPIDCGPYDQIFIVSPDSGHSFGAHISDIVPEPSLPLQLRLKMSVEKFIVVALQILSQEVEQDFRRKGFYR